MSMLSLADPRFRPLPLGSIRPTGWLAQQLCIQADGLSGHLDEFWPDVQRSRWFGGDTEAWERAPYWLDGLVPLAFSLDDPPLKEKVNRYVTYIIAHQGDDGWLGPRAMVSAAGREEDPRYDLWGQLLPTKVLMQYHDATGDGLALDALAKVMRKIDQHVDRAPLFNWGQFRWFEGLIGLFWLYERSQEQWLLDLAVKLHAQGFDWASFFARWPLTQPTPRGRWSYMGHVVNNAMAIKAHALWWRLTQDTRDRAAVYDMIDKLDRYHGTAVGVFTGDECVAGRRPTQGTELCAVVEHAYSLEVLLSILGDPAFGDRLEKVVFNALPATFSPDMWSHQYDQQVNQVECSILDNRSWTTNGPESSIFGVEPNYGCCTANLSQGWPKFAAHLWMRTGDEGLAAVAFAPNTAHVHVQNVPVTARLETDYPFRSTLHFSISTQSPVRFPLYLRIPAWASGAVLEVPGGAMIQPATGAFHCLDRLWESTTELTLTLPMSPTLARRHNAAVCIERGPLVYALRVGEDWRRIHTDRPYRELPHADWEVYPTTPWNYAIDLDEASVANQIRFTEHRVSQCPFSPARAPVSAHVQGRRLPEWQMESGSAMDAPQSPVASAEPVEDLTLIPYGCTNLRIAEFPVLARE